MSRRQQPPLLPVIFDLLKVAPFWVGPILAVIVFVLFRFVSPAFIPATKGGIDPAVLWQPLFSIFAWAFAGAVLVLWVIAEIRKRMDRHLVDNQTGLASIRDIPWREFERLVGEAYRDKSCCSCQSDWRIRGFRWKSLLSTAPRAWWRAASGARARDTLPPSTAEDFTKLPESVGSQLLRRSHIVFGRNQGRSLEFTPQRLPQSSAV